MATTDIRNILYKSIEQEVSSGTNFKLFSVDNTNAYTIRVYIDSSGNKFSFEVNNDSDGTNYKIENYAINQNITIYKNKSSDSDIYYVKFDNNTAFTIRKEIIYGYLTDANTVGTAVAGTPIATLTTSSPKHIFAGNSAFIGNSTVTGDVDFNGGFTAEKDVNLTGNINFHDFYINDFINTPEPGTEQPSGTSKIVFRDDSEPDNSKSVEIYGIYNEILKPIVNDNIYSGKVSVLISISNGTLASETNGGELVLLKLETIDNTPKITYSIIYKDDSISVYRDNIASTVIMDNGNYISNVVTLNFENNANCKVTSVYKKSDNNSITVYEIAQNIIGGGDSNANASHYLLTAQSLSQILTLSSLSAGATTTNLTKNPQGNISYNGTNQYLLYQSGTNTTELYDVSGSGKQFIYSENKQLKNILGTDANTANTVLLRGANGAINVGNIVSNGYIESNGDFYTKTTDTHSLGRSDKYFVNGYIRNIYSTNIATSNITATTANLTTITGKFDKTLTVKGAGATVALYNGSADDEFNIIAGANISVSGNANGNITITHPNHTAATLNAGFTSTYKLSIPNVKSDDQGHIIENTRTEVDLSEHYLRCDADDEKSGLTTFTGNVNIKSASNSENANSGKIIFSDTSNDTISIFKSDITETGHSLCTKIFDNGITATYKFSFKNFGNNATYEYTMPNKAGTIMLTNDNYAGSASSGGPAKSVANSFTYGVDSNAATYNGSAAKTLYIAGSNGLSTSFNGSNTVTISHPTYTSHTQTATWGSGGDAHKLVIPKIKSNSYGHIESVIENETIDLSKHYLRCDASDTMSSVLTITGPHLDTSNGLLSAPDGSLTLGAGQGRIYGNAIGFTCPGISTDAGRMRVLGTGEADTVLELATGDDGGGGESIHFRGYNTNGSINYDVSVPKETGTILTTSSAKIEKTSDEQFSITINGKTITFKQTGGEGSPLEITCS